MCFALTGHTVKAQEPATGALSTEITSTEITYEQFPDEFKSIIEPTATIFS
ncbi:hypothetical protein SDC9_97188 [bioreactor metagenome]|uniref:Uncharacterized protein n=1 Tax=bioreactor metagenome TaxID=1076179 RepID=A0A645AB51_9ZZZZ